MTETGAHAALAWLEDPSESNGIHLDVDGEWQLVSFASLARYSMAVSQQVRVARDDMTGRPVAIVSEDPLTFLAAFYGVAVAGGVPVPVAPPTPFDRSGRDVRVIPGVISASRGDLVVVEPTLADRVSRLLADAACPAEVLPVEMRQDGDVDVSRSPQPDLALVQFTSGSTGAPRPVKVTWDNLASQIKVLGDFLGRQDDDGLVSWLPHYHDMGLIGCLLSPIALDVDVWLQRPLQFLLDPTRWVRCLGSGRVAGTAAPCFGYALARSKVADAALEGLDFSNVRACVVGAERVDFTVMNDFARWLRPWGLAPHAIAPAYGLAEATLAVSMSPPGSVGRAFAFDWKALTFGERVVIESVHSFGEDESASAHDAICASGAPLPGTTVRVYGDAGELPELHLGEIVVTGAQVTGDGSGSAELWTGDAGFFVGDDLVVLGRIGDSLKVRGRHVFAEDLEAAIVADTQLLPSQVVVSATPEAATGGVAVFVESEVDDVTRAAIEAVLRQGIGTAEGSVLVQVPPSSLERTSSGKPRRRAMWDALRRGAWASEPFSDDLARRG